MGVTVTLVVMALLLVVLLILQLHTAHHLGLVKRDLHWMRAHMAKWGLVAPPEEKK